MKKKGQFDLFEIVTALITVALLVLIVLLVNSSVSDKMKTMVSNSSVAYQAIDKAESTFSGTLDKLFLGIFFILLLGMVILAFRIQSSVLFLLLFIILSVISTWFAAVISNVYMEVEATGVFASELLHTPIMTFLMENLPIFIAAFAMILLIITYSKDVLFQRVGVEP